MNQVVTSHLIPKGEISRREAVRAAFSGAFLAVGFSSTMFGQNLDRARDLVSRVQEDLRRAADFNRDKEKERQRYEDAQHHLSDFDRDLRRDHFDKGKLDQSIDDLKDLVQKNTLESHDRDALAADLADLRAIRDMR